MILVLNLSIYEFGPKIRASKIKSAETRIVSEFEIDGMKNEANFVH